MILMLSLLTDYWSKRGPSQLSDKHIMQLKSFALLFVISALAIAQPIPYNEPSPSVSKNSFEEQGESWQEQLEQVEYKPGDEYEEDQFEEYANDYSLLLPDPHHPAEANPDARV
ncbi:hypothetical protein K493DRAFT_307893 [Basidiobolus meristosporus CBS 931.73]|uniref:Uncharacterized protein n=1 Tax=Basidiobolus meristosporus CBS 931.73 TaxID=1314790 RepID=A0A1Y1X8S3_9FUNG|nr:hypothetical protein K493DRAFT_307893 [Basidiobolus meristosporus CBS 931.73]|eukprot:ORX82119.1 hypothetical protein K493DRAFT_307893 [Basidiobolus meristosporus CBS 931.73]